MNDHLISQMQMLNTAGLMDDRDYATYLSLFGHMVTLPIDTHGWMEWACFLHGGGSMNCNTQCFGAVILLWCRWRVGHWCVQANFMKKPNLIVHLDVDPEVDLSLCNSQLVHRGMHIC